MDLRTKFHGANFIRAIAWAARVNQIATRKTLNRVLRLACLCITGAMRTCPTEVLLELTPLHLHIQMQTKRAHYRMQLSNDDTMVRAGRRSVKILQNLPEYLPEYQNLPILPKR